VVVFGKWSLWALITVTTLGIAVALAVAGNLVIAVAVVVVGAIYNLRDNTKL
jgi:hypothetical protein